MAHGVHNPGDIPWRVCGTGLCHVVLPLHPLHTSGGSRFHLFHVNGALWQLFPQRPVAPGARGAHQYFSFN